MKEAAANICMDKKLINIFNKSINISRLLQYTREDKYDKQ